VNYNTPFHLERGESNKVQLERTDLIRGRGNSKLSACDATGTAIAIWHCAKCCVPIRSLCLIILKFKFIFIDMFSIMRKKISIN